MKEILKEFLKLVLVIAVLMTAFSALAIAEGKSPGLNSEWQTATASWYGPEFYGKQTACGEVLTPYTITAASREYPCNTILEVWHGGQSTFLRINDYGPAAWTRRDIDLSYMSARVLGFSGVGEVQVRVVYLPEEEEN